MKNSISSLTNNNNNPKKLKRELSNSKLNNSVSMSSFENLNLRSPKQKSNNDLEMRLRKLETILSLLTNQNEILIKRVDELEHKTKSSRNSNFNNTRCNSDEEGVSKETYLRDKDENSEWKKDVEFSIEKISEKVAANNNSNNYTANIEKKINEVIRDFLKFKTETEENLDQANMMNKNFEKYEKSEKLINELLSQISIVKTSNIKWQSDFLKNMNEYDEKLMNTEIHMDQLDKQDKIIHKKLDSLQIDLKRKENNLLESYEVSNNNFNEKLLNHTKKFNELEEKCRNFLESNNVFILEYKEENSKIENNIKALWDSFTLFTTSK